MTMGAPCDAVASNFLHSLILSIFIYLQYQFLNNKTCVHDKILFIAGFEDDQATTLTKLQNTEDGFIEHIALGSLLVKDQDGNLVAGSLEGLIAQLIHVIFYLIFLPSFHHCHYFVINCCC
jgi:hypothetical protein